MSHHSAGETGRSPCRKACPAGVDIPRYIRHIQESRFDEARRVVREHIPFSAVCGYACRHPCESSCARVQFDESIAIRMLKLAVEEHRQRADQQGIHPLPSGWKTAIIGSGPCGLTAAYYLALKGHVPVVYEAEDKAGGLLRYGIPSYRLPREALEREISLIQSLGVIIHTGTRIQSPEKFLEEGYRAVLLATGAWQPLRLGIDGEDSPLVVDGLSFLRELNAGDRRFLSGGRVLVIGGGNTAIDAARSARRLGASATIVYRRGRQYMPAGAEEIEDALEEGVEIITHTTPVHIYGSKITCLKMIEGPPDASGRPKPVVQENSEFTLEADLVLMAIGQTGTTAQFLTKEGKDLHFDVDPETSATNISGLFAAGDAVLGPSGIIDAIAQGRKATVSIDRFLGGDGLIATVANLANGDPPEALPRGTGRVKRIKTLAQSRRHNFEQVELVYGRDAVIGEARRCLSCDLRNYDVSVDDRLCKECGFCQEVCTLNVFETADHFNTQGYRPTAVKSGAHCIGCLGCLYICPDFAITVSKRTLSTENTTLPGAQRQA